MRFEMLYLLSRLRGLFPANHKGSLGFGRADKKTVREMYRGGFIPYRIDNLVTYR